MLIVHSGAGGRSGRSESFRDMLAVELGDYGNMAKITTDFFNNLVIILPLAICLRFLTVFCETMLVFSS